MFRIAIVSGNEHYKSGGVETFARYLIGVCEKNDIDFDEVVYKPKRERKRSKNVSSPLHDQGVIDISGLDAGTPLKPVRTIEKWIKENKYDLIIMNSALWCVSKKILKSDKVLFVQHGNYDNNSWANKNVGDRIRLFFNSLIGISILGNPYGMAKNTVYFCKETDKSNNNIQNKFFSVLPSKFKIEKGDENRLGATLIGRIDWHIKGLDILETVKHDIENLSLFGTGDEKKALEHFGSMYKGALRHDEVQSTMKSKRTFVMTSRQEGFPFTIVEALSSGCAVVVLDTFDSVGFFKKCKSVFIFKQEDVKGMAEKINWIDSLSKEDFEKIEEESLSFAKDNFSIETFEKNWLSIINTFV